MASLEELFDATHPDHGSEGSLSWNQAVFSRAYLATPHRLKGSFDEVITKLELGFSVLVYIHGTCMSAAAACVRQHTGGGWREYGHELDKSGITGIWSRSADIMETLKKWLEGTENQPPRAIFHNLEFLTTGQGSIYPAAEAQTALFSLIATTRNGQVLGLADLGAGELPHPLERAFPERLKFDEIPYDHFHRIIPLELGRKLEANDELPETTVWLLWSRLRWCDPIRAVKIMRAASKNLPRGNLEEALRRIWRLTRSGRFREPQPPWDIKGFSAETLQFLQNSIIAPYKSWLAFRGSQKECERELQKLPPGLILYGPPGTGKTYLAKWVADSIGLPMLVESSANLKSSYHGESEKNVHALFQEARRGAPCVVILDDADDMFPDRNRLGGSVAGVELGMVQAALQELEGMEGRPSGVLVIATTNRFEALDPGIRTRLRAQVKVPYPLSEDQIREIMGTVAEAYHFHLEDNIANQLVKRFWQPIIPDPTMSLNTPADRWRAQENLFSARDIQHALLLLQEGNPAKIRDGKYVPDEADVARMLAYYETLAGGR